MYTNELCLGVFVDNKLPTNKLYSHELIPKKFLGIKTDVIQTPIATPLNNAYNTDSNLIDKAILRSYKRPLQPGFAIGTENSGLGTLGAIVFDKKKQPYILSNNHVLAATNKKNFGAKISQPPYDENNIDYLNKVVAFLYKQVVINFGIISNDNFIDCALAKILPDVPYTTEIYKIGKVKGVTDAYPGMEVKKAGATTGYTTSVVKYINAIRTIDFKPSTVFSECIICDEMSAPGDSGSLVLDNNNNAIGLLFAGITESILNPIELILKYLDVDF